MFLKLSALKTSIISGLGLLFFLAQPAFALEAFDVNGDPVSSSCSAIGSHVPASCWDDVIWEVIGKFPGQWPMINSEEIIYRGLNSIVRNGDSINYDVYSSHDGYARYSANCKTYDVSIIRTANTLAGYSVRFLFWHQINPTVTIGEKIYKNPMRDALEISCLEAI
jgi:hypothetical protein